MANRSYSQFCPIAVALDVVGDRWTLLVMRELTMGERRFTDLKAALPGIAPNLLAERLRDLQADGLVEQRELPAPAARTVYAVTEAGRDVLPVLRALARFGAARLGSLPEGSAFDSTRAVYSLLAPFHAPEPAGQRLHARVHVDGQDFDIVTEGESLSMRPREHDRPDVEVELSVEDLVAVRQGRSVVLPAEAERFARLFQLV